MKLMTPALIFAAALASPPLALAAPAATNPVVPVSGVEDADPTPRVFPQDGPMRFSIQHNEPLNRRSNGRPIIPTAG